ncbi:hypothetical protein BC628DRAFT_125964 [Trametes gibbosa]|nr:hypothetical protein BC628DRAFT_125964 [Trametes gibbosa]
MGGGGAPPSFPASNSRYGSIGYQYSVPRACCRARTASPSRAKRSAILILERVDGFRGERWTTSALLPSSASVEGDTSVDINVVHTAQATTTRLRPYTNWTCLPSSSLLQTDARSSIRGCRCCGADSRRFDATNRAPFVLEALKLEALGLDVGSRARSSPLIDARVRACVHAFPRPFLPSPPVPCAQVAPLLNPGFAHHLPRGRETHRLLSSSRPKIWRTPRARAHTPNTRQDQDGTHHVPEHRRRPRASTTARRGTNARRRPRTTPRSSAPALRVLTSARPGNSRHRARARSVHSCSPIMHASCAPSHGARYTVHGTLNGTSHHPRRTPGGGGKGRRDPSQPRANRAARTSSPCPSRSPTPARRRRRRCAPRKPAPHEACDRAVGGGGGRGGDGTRSSLAGFRGRRARPSSCVVRRASHGTQRDKRACVRRRDPTTQ